MVLCQSGNLEHPKEHIKVRGKGINPDWETSNRHRSGNNVSRILNVFLESKNVLKLITQNTHIDQILNMINVFLCIST